MTNNWAVIDVSSLLPTNGTAPQWMINFVEFRKQLFLTTVEPIIVTLLGPVEEELGGGDFQWTPKPGAAVDADTMHRRLSFLPSYITEVSNYHETQMSFSGLIMLFLIMSCVLLIFLSCFFHNQKTSPLFISPRRHRLPKLVPPPLPVDGYFEWIKVCLFMSDEEIIQRVGYDSLIFLRFHRLALRCIVKMSLFSFVVLLPLNYTGGGGAKADDLAGYVGSLFFTDFMRFTMANVAGGSPRLWVHCFAAYLLTMIVVRELLIEYETFNSIRHAYLLSREPHLRTVLVTNIPRHLRSPGKIGSYFRHVYPDAVKSVVMCQNVIQLEALVAQRTTLLATIEKELLLLCRFEKSRLFEKSKLWTAGRLFNTKLEEYGIKDGSQERFSKLYSELENLNKAIEQEQRRRKRVMKRLDDMEAGEGRKDIDYILANPFVVANDPNHQRLLGLSEQQKLRQSQAGQTTSHRVPTGQPPIVDEEVSTPMSQATAESGLHSSGKLQELRSRSPAYSVNDEDGKLREPQYDYEEMEGQPPSERHVTFEKDGMPKGKPYNKAKSAIRRYSRLSREVSFLGRPIRSSVAVGSDGHIEDHINEVTDKAFVVMRTFTAATIAIQSMHSSKPGSMQVSTAPEPRDILWGNIYLSKGAMRTRSFLADILVMLIITFYVIPVATVTLLVSESALVSSSPRLAQLDSAATIFSTAIAMIQPLCLVALQQLQPPLFMAIGRLEGMLSFSGVQMRAFSRYFLFQVVNIFLVTTISGTIFDTIAAIVENPEAAFEMLGNSLPRQSSFFITFVTMKAFLGLGVELVRTMSIVQATIRYIFVPNPTLRTARSIIAGMRAIDDPGWFPFHKILAQDMLVVVISVVFAVVAPIVLFPCALFCIFARIMWTHHHLYVYESVFESGGQFFPKIFRRFVFGLVIAQMTITGQFILKEARHQAYATIALIFMTYFFLRRTRARYDPTSSTLPLEVATVMDIALTQEEMTKKRTREAATAPKPPHPSARSYDDSDRRTQTTSSLPDVGINDIDPDLGAKIGRYDPFQKAYLQPALRANPNAKPEQPFPPAQLGSEEVFFGRETPAGDDDLYDTGATVRLKTYNQQDRHLLNRWWKDQLQRCGDQNIFAILTGEECGTLSIGRTNVNESRIGDHVLV